MIPPPPPHHRLLPVLKKKEVVMREMIARLTWIYSPQRAIVIEMANCDTNVTIWTKSSARYCPVVCCYQLVLASKSSSP